MEVDGDGIAQRDRSEPVPVPAAHYEPAPVCRIRMEVHTVPVAQLPHACGIVYGAEVRAPHGGHGAVRIQACGGIFLEHPLERLQVDPASVIDGDLAHSAVSHAEDVRCLVHGEMRDLRCVDAELPVFRGKPFELHVPAESPLTVPVARRDDCGDVGLGPSGREASVPGSRETE